MKRRTMVCMSALAVVFLYPTPALAYLDPGTGGMALQALLAVIAAGLVAVKSWWGTIKAFFGKKKKEDD